MCKTLFGEFVVLDRDGVEKTWVFVERADVVVLGMSSWQLPQSSVVISYWLVLSLSTTQKACTQQTAKANTHNRDCGSN